MSALLAVISSLFSSCSQGLGSFSKGPAEPVEFRKLNFSAVARPERLTQSLALADFDQFSYILRHGYSGFEDADQRPSQRISERLQSVEKTLTEVSGSIDLATYERLLAGCLQDLQDGHIAISGGETYRGMEHRDYLVSRQRLFDSPQADGGDSADPLSPTVLLPVLKNGKKAWVAGQAASAQKISSKPSSPQLERIHIEPRKPGELVIVSNDRVGFIGLRTLDDSTGTRKKLLAEFAATAVPFRKKDFVVLDFRGNSGGSDSHWFKFLAQLFDCDSSVFVSRLRLKDLESPVTGQGYDHLFEVRTQGQVLPKVFRIFEDRRRLTDSNRKYQFWNTLIPRSTGGSRSEDSTGFSGQIILIFDRQTASSAESIYRALGSARAVLIGENSYGAIHYGNVLSYTLPHSGLVLGIPASKFESLDPHEPYGGDGWGFQPQYWCPTIDWLAETLSDLTGQDSVFFESVL